jgi:hypothetical protein
MPARAPDHRRRRGLRATPLLVAVLTLGLLALARAEVLVLTDGDRITGQVVAKGTKRIRVQTAYGLLVIPREKVERIKKDDGTEEVLNAPAPPPPPPPTTPPVPGVRLVLAITGSTFWQAWDPKAAPTDCSLRLLVQLDGRAIGAYRDPVLDPQDLPKATVNTFSFLPDSVSREPEPGVKLLPPETRTGRIHLPMEIPTSEAASHKLRIVYQSNDGPVDAPRWQDLAQAVLDFELDRGRPTVIRIEQARGAMEFAKKHMKGVETFVIGARLDTPPPEP